MHQLAAELSSQWVQGPTLQVVDTSANIDLWLTTESQGKFPCFAFWSLHRTCRMGSLTVMILK